MRFAILCACSGAHAVLAAQLPAADTVTLEQQLLKEGTRALAQAAEDDGNARRGAVAFHQYHSACIKCHATGHGDSPLGPDLTTTGQRADYAHVVESILQPSKTIVDPFQAIQLTTNAGRTHVGLLANDAAERVQLRDAANFGKLITIAKDDIDEIHPINVSLMPSGSANQLASRQEFLDLVKYVVVIGQRGPDMAVKLQPEAADLEALAAESIDHAAQIRGLGAEELRLGGKLYAQYCLNCHGRDGNKTLNPLARRFAKDTLKFGTDPYSMWKTVTYGNGLMFSQISLLSPAERYAVVHYIRETFIRDTNPTQYYQAADEYYARVNATAKSDVKKMGGQVVSIQIAPGMIDGKQGAEMNYGPYLSHSMAFTRPANKDAARFEDTTERALVVKLPGGLVACYDVERYSVSGIWQGRIANTNQTHHTSYKGSSCLTPGGEVIYHNVDDAGWAIDNPVKQAPEERVAFQGHHLHGGQVLLRFNVGGRAVDELPSALNGSQPLFARTLRVGAGDAKLLCLVGRLADGQATLSGDAARIDGKDHQLAATIRGETKGLAFVADGRGGLWLAIPPAAADRTFTLWIRSGEVAKAVQLPRQTTAPDLDALKQGGPRRWPRQVRGTAIAGKPIEGYAADEIVVPYANPWGSWMRTTAIDFFSDGRLAVATLRNAGKITSVIYWGSKR